MTATAGGGVIAGAVDGDAGSDGLAASAIAGLAESERALIQVSSFSRRIAVAMESIATAATVRANPLNGRSTKAMVGSSPSRL
jgi:hypothetical protein